MGLAASKEVGHATHPNDFAAMANCIGEQVSEMFSAAVQTGPVSKAPMEGATTGIMSVPLAQLVAVLATEAEEEATVVVAMAKETAEAMGTLSTVIMPPSMELTSLIPSAVSPQ